ncbi:hypothetical protein DUZ99_19900 [Xylanibacillus composti]|uniref:Uncharacterized protein n=1 Tax=Xylanibacillus composti TaxID=1572762 RepID=A0A8J4M4T7_9BACL|nr:hypothetical protein [Xylanibacillus composti]GIQ71121.1 hypothetical protein XYCOK13_39450 [Xylanibacillus composti]
MTDILQKLIDNEITVDQAHDILDQTIDDFHDGKLAQEIHEALHLDNYEWTAICHSINLGVLAEWRQSGWPGSCSQCGTEIDYKKYGWTIKNNQLKGLNCC